MMSLIEKNISMPYPKKYSKSPSVVHSIRAICEKTTESKYPLYKKKKIFFLFNQGHHPAWIEKKKIQFFFYTMERDSACEVIQENIAAFSQLALIECTTDGDLEYFLGYGIEIFFFSIKVIIRHGLKKKIEFFFSIKVVIRHGVKKYFNFLY